MASGALKKRNPVNKTETPPSNLKKPRVKAPDTADHNMVGDSQLATAPIISVDEDAVEPTATASQYVSPLERYQRMRDQQVAEIETVTTVESLANFIRTNDVDQPSVRARLQAKGRVIWTSDHIVTTGELAKIHIVDLQAPESLEKLQKFRGAYDSDYLAIDKLLITAAVFGCTASTPGMPPDGAIMTITNPSKVSLFMDKACQLRVRLANLTFEE